MKYYSTRDKTLRMELGQAVRNGLAPDGGLYMPERIQKLPDSFFQSIENRSFHEISCAVARAFFGEDVPQDALDRIVTDTLSFDCPLRKVEEGIYALELFHGPTLAFKDVGARFMARLLSHFGSEGGDVNVLVATSGDTGSAVANGFLNVPGIRVFVLYPKGRVSPIQECQFATLGRNITALEVDGVFDDCQALVKRAFLDGDLKSKLTLTSANSINVARFLPQAFYYFNAYARMKAIGLADELVVSVPSGNFGNLCAGLFAKRMGLPVKRFIAANNANDVVYEYLQSGKYVPRASVQTIANAMDVGAPSNFERILDLYGNSVEAVRRDISGARYSDEQIRSGMAYCLSENGYMLDPHGACGYMALKDGLRSGECGVFLETAHPAKFGAVVESATGNRPSMPERLAAFTKNEKRSLQLPNDYDAFRSVLLDIGG